MIKPYFSGEVFTKWLSGARRLMAVTKQVTFVDANGVHWVAPVDSLVDGASIPRVFWFFMGSPFVGKYRRASVVHDVYCKSKSRPHKQVHKMFYDAARYDGVNYFKAKAMYYAIRLGGPKW